MSTEYIKPAVFEKYGTSMYVGVGIPIPVLDADMLKHLCVEDKDIYTFISDYSNRGADSKPVAKVSYAQLKSGFVELDGKKIRTSPLTSLSKSREIAALLADLIREGKFTLNEPLTAFPQNNKLNSLKIRGKNK